jgi:hypothetical protein
MEREKGYYNNVESVLRKRPGGINGEVFLSVQSSPCRPAYALVTLLAADETEATTFSPLLLMVREERLSLSASNARSKRAPKNQAAPIWIRVSGLFLDDD